MPVSPTYPGVYVQEIASGVRTIAGVATSIGMFIGTSKMGPMFQPISCVSYSDFTRNFSDDPAGGALAEYVKFFFLNGGTNCYVMRIANGATYATVDLKNEAGTKTLTLKAKNPGLAGETIRATVTYSTQQPEATFNIDLFRWVVDSTGRRTKTGAESWKNLSMDPNSPVYAADFLTQNSKLVNATDLGVAAVPGFSASGRAVTDSGDFHADWSPLWGSTATTNGFKISVNGLRYVDVNLSSFVVSTMAQAQTDIATAIHDAYNNQGIGGVNVTVTFPASAGSGARRLVIAPAAGNGDVFIKPGSLNDLAVPLMLGTDQGGVEVSGNAVRRPAANAITFHAANLTVLDALADLPQDKVTTLTLDAVAANGSPTTAVINLQQAAPAPNLTTAGAGKLFSLDGFASTPNGHGDGIREKFAIIAELVNGYTPAPNVTFPWTAEVWGSRLALIPSDAVGDNFVSASFALASAPALPGNAFTSNNVKYYSVGADGQNKGLQASAGGPAYDGDPPDTGDYDTAYGIIDREVDLFNLLVLPPDSKPSVQKLYPAASIFCQSRRAFLIMDPPTTWTNAQQAATGVAALRVGLVKDFSAVYFPRITIDRSGKSVNIGPAGAIAGLYARIDGTRGVWKAPAGTEADLRGITGLEYKLSDGENGITNPRAVNTLRVFPSGIVGWGARTMDGDDGFGSEYKYVPIRRLALYIEESLYRGLQWVVFEPNDAPLWAQIRLNVGAFMHDLFRQGAFEGQTPTDAYFVKCDAETTTESDRNLGIVNIMVGFAPLKPAEFVILYLQQMAGQIQV